MRIPSGTMNGNVPKTTAYSGIYSQYLILKYFIRYSE
jgi:hypothetical protein